MIISWKILKLECIPNKNGLENVVFHVHFEYIGEKTIDGILYSSSSFGVILVEDPNVNSFTPVNELTKEQVISWIENKVDSFALNTTIENNIESMILPKSIVIDFPFED